MATQINNTDGSSEIINNGCRTNRRLNIIYDLKALTDHEVIKQLALQLYQGGVLDYSDLEELGRELGMVLLDKNEQAQEQISLPEKDERNYTDREDGKIEDLEL